MADEKPEQEQDKDKETKQEQEPESLKHEQKSHNSPIHAKSQNILVFPPNNHENLHNLPQSPFSSEPPSPLSLPGNYPGDGYEAARRWVELFGNRVLRGVDWVRSYWGGRDWGGGSWGVAGVVLVWWVWVAVRRRRRRRVREESRDHLVMIIKEKDEKIKQLLNQIAQMNNLLLSLHKSTSSQGRRVT